MKKNNTKKLNCVLLSIVLLCLTLVISFAKDNSQIELKAVYNQEKSTVTVYYVITDFKDTESADFTLNYDTEKLTPVSYSTASKIRNNGGYFVEMGPDAETAGNINIIFVALEKVEDDILDSNGKSVVAKIDFEVKQKENINFTAFSTSFTYSPSTDFQLQSKDLNVDCTGSDTTASTNESNTKNIDSSFEFVDITGDEAPQEDIRQQEKKKSGLTDDAKKKIKEIAIICVVLLLLIVLFIVFYVKKVNHEDDPEKKKKTKVTTESKKKKTDDDDVKIDEEVLEKLDTKKEERLQRHYTSTDTDFVAPTVNMDDDMSDYNSDRFDD